jgi:hypothetical protein
MRLLGGVAGTLIAILTLTWAVQGDDFFLSGMLFRTTNRVRRVLWGPPGAATQVPDTAPSEAPPEVAASDPRVASAGAPPATAPPRSPAAPRAEPSRPATPAPADPSAPVATAPPSLAPRPRVMTVMRRGPIVERPGSRTPLLMADEGTGLTLLGIEGEWFKVEYTDRTPPFRRVGYIHVQYMRANAGR